MSHLEKAMYEAMFGALPDAAMLTDGAGKIRLVNPAFISLFQYRPDEVIGQGIDVLSARRADGDAPGNIHLPDPLGDAPNPGDVRYRKQGEVEQLKNRLQAENVYLQEEITTAHHCDQISGQSKGLQEVLRRATGGAHRKRVVRP